MRYSQRTKIKPREFARNYGFTLVHTESHWGSHGLTLLTRFTWCPCLPWSTGFPWFTLATRHLLVYWSPQVQRFWSRTRREPQSPFSIPATCPPLWIAYRRLALTNCVDWFVHGFTVTIFYQWYSNHCGGHFPKSLQNWLGRTFYSKTYSFH